MSPIWVVVLVLCSQQVLAGPLPGAIFTTLEDGSRVNANIYELMEDVYLDGGPGNNAPASAAGLPEGDYYFQVTDPSGKVLLSEDAVKCRRFHVGADGFITAVIPASALVKVKGKLVDSTCSHNTGIDADHGDIGAITVQLMPYARTPNKGGVYKVWVTPVEKFVGDPEMVDNPDYFHGFVPAWSKTDNYKVRRGRPCDPRLLVHKFDDSDADGIWDPEEVAISGWAMTITPPAPAGLEDVYYTDVNIIAEPEGLWTITEETRSGWLQTALFIDDAPRPVSDTAQVVFEGLCDEIHLVTFGNIELANITACKFDDGDGNGVNDGEPPVPNILFVLEGNDIRGDAVRREGRTGTDGCVGFSGLLPGDYNLCEVPPAGWLPTTDVCVSVSLAEADNLTFSFGNIRLGSITACKFYDANENGVNDQEPPLAGILFTLDGIDVQGNVIHQEGCTQGNGCITFSDLLPGDYTVCEVLPDGWVSTTAECVNVTLPEGGDLTFSFGNVCFVPNLADFSTKGYWHNKNGITELQSNPTLYAAVLAFVHSLDPYDDASGYFGKGDEPALGDPVPAGKGVLENEDIADAGTKEAEISNFLIDSVGDGGQREQLAQQLLAFIFNVHYRIGEDLGTPILLGDGTEVAISDLIACAVSAWSDGSDPDCMVNEMAPLMDWFNNNDSVVFMTVSPEPCPFEPMCD
jgi:hypothetical protein